LNHCLLTSNLCVETTRQDGQRHRQEGAAQAGFYVTKYHDENPYPERSIRDARACVFK
jgi:hypothetical protein